MLIRKGGFMERQNSLIIYILFIIVCLLMGCTSKDPRTGNPIVEKDIILIVEPYIWECTGHPGQTRCLIINGEGSYDKITGFQHEEGVWKKLLVNKFERPEVAEGRLVDVGRYDVSLKEELDTIRQVDNPTARKLCEFYEGQWTENTKPNCRIEKEKLREKYCEHKPEGC